MKRLLLAGLICLASMDAMAGDDRRDAVIGGALGGAAGAVIGQQVGGPTEQPSAAPWVARWALAWRLMIMTTISAPIVAGMRPRWPITRVMRMRARSWPRGRWPTIRLTTPGPLWSVMNTITLWHVMSRGMWAIITPRGMAASIIAIMTIEP